MNNDKLIIGGHEFNSRFILGSGKYSMKLIEAAVKDWHSGDDYYIDNQDEFEDRLMSDGMTMGGM